MRLELSKSAATAALLVSVTARLFYGLSLDAPEAANAVWLAAPLGLALALPAVWLSCKCPRRLRRLLALALFVPLAIDAVNTIEWTAYSESCLAFEHISPALMALPLLLAIARCCWLGMDALGGAARIWSGLFALLMVVVILCQLPCYHPGWLAPWLGNGFNSIMMASVRAAGWIALLSSGAVVACNDGLLFRDVLKSVLLATTVATALVALRRMMSPAMALESSRAIGIDALLTNGRGPLYLQLPMIVAWFAGMLHLMCFEALAACAMVRRLLSRASEAVCVVIGLGAVFALSFWRVPSKTPCLYPALTGALLLLWHIGRRDPRRESSA